MLKLFTRLSPKQVGLRLRTSPQLHLRPSLVDQHSTPTPTTYLPSLRSDTAYHHTGTAHLRCNYHPQTPLSTRSTQCIQRALYGYPVHAAKMPSAKGENWEKYQKKFADDEVEEKKITPLSDEYVATTMLPPFTVSQQLTAR